MTKEKITISECREGDILASDVLNSKGIILMTKDTILTSYMIEQFIKLGIVSLTIYRFGDGNQENIHYQELRECYQKSVIRTRKLLQDLASGKSLDYENVSKISESIYSCINENDSIIKCVTAMKNFDEYTYTHSVNTAFYSMLIGKWLGLSKTEINKAIQSGLLHDIGKTRISDEILNKAGKLTNEEFNIIKKHPEYGFEMVKDIAEIDDDIKKAILLHHERMNGSGYPYHYGAEGMNLYARIIALADVFDAMTSDRAYKKKTTPFEAFEMFQTIGISLFDTNLIEVFCKHLATNLVGSNVLLSSGDTGQIVYVPLHDLTSPVVKVESQYMNISEQKNIQILSML